MKFTREQKKAAYKKLPLEMQDFIMDAETTELIDGYLKKYGFSEEESILADLEILYAMYELQTLDDAMTAIKKLSNKSEYALSELKKDLENNIFSKINDLKKEESSKEPAQNNNENAVSINNTKSLDKGVKNKVDEIVTKYSLNASQSNSLQNIVANILSGIKTKDKLPDDLLKELSISRLLATQISNDLDERVFEYAINTIGEVEPDTTAPKAEAKTSLPTSSLPAVQKDSVVEIRPTMSPMVEKGEVAHTTPQTKPVSFVQPQKPAPSSADPVSVPRYIPENLPAERVAKKPWMSIMPINPPTPTPSAPTPPSRVVSAPVAPQSPSSGIVFKHRGDGPFPQANTDSSVPTPASNLAPSPAPSAPEATSVGINFKPSAVPLQRKPIEKAPEKYETDPYRESLE